MKRLLTALFLLLLSVSTGYAQSNILFNGGISQEERATAPNRGTRLVFFVRAGNFLADVKVVVTNAAGVEVVNTTAEGPWLILDLPDGRYQVSATISSGETQSIAIEVAGNKEFGFMFSSVE